MIGLGIFNLYFFGQEFQAKDLKFKMKQMETSGQNFINKIGIIHVC